MTNKDNGGMTQLGFLAVSKTASRRMVTFPLIDGFDKAGPEADLQTQLAKSGDWKGYALAIDGKGKLRLKGVCAKK